MDEKKTLKWLNDVCEYAMREIQENQNLDIASRLGGHPATQHYFNNVFTRTTIAPDRWAQDYSTYMQQADALREAYEADDKVEQHDDRISAIETGLNELKAAVAKLLENAEAAAVPTPEPAPVAKPKATKKAQKRTETPEEQPDEEEAEADEEQAEPEGE